MAFMYLKLFKSHFIPLQLGVHMHVCLNTCVCMRVGECMGGIKRTTCMSQLTISTLCILGTELRSPVLVMGHLTS